MRVNLPSTRLQQPLKFGAVCIQTDEQPSQDQLNAMATRHKSEPSDVWVGARRAHDGGMVYYAATGQDAKDAEKAKQKGTLNSWFAKVDAPGVASKFPTSFVSYRNSPYFQDDSPYDQS